MARDRLICDATYDMARDIDTFEFDPSDASRVTEAMEHLAGANDGWINLLPGVSEEGVPEHGRAGIFGGVFGSPQAPVAMGTWIPAKKSRPNAVATIGILHPRGRRAVSQLAALGVALPSGWQVRQDHARRGLIVRVPASERQGAVLDWALAAGTTLSMVPLTGMWEARVYQPR